LRPLTASLTPPGNGLIRTLTNHREFETGREIDTLTGHNSSINAVAVSSDGKYLVSCSSDNRIKVWELATRKEINTLTGHSSSVNAVALSSGAKYVVSGSDDNTIKIWDLATANVIHTLTGHSNAVNAVALSSDDKYIISGSYDNTIKVWELSMAKEIVTFISEGIVTCCAITPDNATIIAGDTLGKVHFLRLEGMEVQS
jgi:WD40 repeat protein